MVIDFHLLLNPPVVDSPLAAVVLVSFATLPLKKAAERQGSPLLNPR
jgi:hypothetical protein